MWCFIVYAQTSPQRKVTTSTRPRERQLLVHARQQAYSFVRAAVMEIRLPMNRAPEALLSNRSLLERIAFLSKANRAAYSVSMGKVSGHWYFIAFTLMSRDGKVPLVTLTLVVAVRPKALATTVRSEATTRGLGGWNGPSILHDAVPSDLVLLRQKSGSVIVAGQRINE